MSRHGGNRGRRRIGGAVRRAPGGPSAGAQQLRVVVLTAPGTIACSAIARLLGASHAPVVGILVRSASRSLRERLRGVLQGVRTEGWSSLSFGRAFTAWLERVASRVVREEDVDALLARAFPGSVSRLEQFEVEHHIPVVEVGDPNRQAACDTLRGLRPDLAVVLGTAPLGAALRALPRLGWVRLQLGRPPRHASDPPGLRELYDGEPSVDVTVHRVAGSESEGGILGAERIAIHPGDSGETLAQRLMAGGSELLARSVAAIAEGRGTIRLRAIPDGRPGEPAGRVIRPRVGGPTRPAWVEALKTCLYLLIFGSGLFHLVRGIRRITGVRRASILLYHRVNDFADDPLTTRVRRFAEHMLVARRYYTVVQSASLVESVRSRRPLPSDTVAIHFDDCYRDVHTHAGPILRALGFPACSFIASGYVGMDRVFAHDMNTPPWALGNLHRDDVQAWARAGFEIGSHTVNHVDLGQCGRETALAEVTDSKRELEAMTGGPIALFSYPFGRKSNISDEVIQLIEKAGYEAVFSAHGGYVTGRSNPFDLPRVGVSGRSRPLDLLMDVEGLSLGALRARWRSVWQGPE